MAWTMETMARATRTNASSLRLSKRSTSAPAKMGRMRMGMERMPETSPTQRLESVRAYMTHDCKAVRATAPMSKRASDAKRRAKPGIARTRRTWGGRRGRRVAGLVVTK